MLRPTCWALAILAFAQAAGPRVATAVDATGHWYFNGSDPLSINQVGSIMVMAFGESSIRGPWTFPFPVIIDPQTGEFATKWDTPGCLGAPVLRGTLAPDGMSMRGSGLAAGGAFHGLCNPPQPFTFIATRSLCGNGVVDAGEDCDPCVPNCGERPCTDVAVGCRSTGCDYFPIACNDGDARTGDFCELGACQHPLYFCNAKLLRERFRGARSVLGTECDGHLQEHTGRKLRHRLAKARADSLQAAHTESAQEFDRPYRRARHLLDASMILAFDASGDPSICEDPLREAIDEVIRCLGYLKRPRPSAR